MSDPSVVVRPFRGVSAAERMAQRRDALMDAGLSALADENRAAITINDVIARAGVSKRYFYEHFRTRDDLFVALGERLVEQITAAVVVAAKAPPTDVRGRIHDAMTGVVSVLIEDPRNARLFVDMIGGNQLKDTVDRTEHAIASMLIDSLTVGTTLSGDERIRLDLAGLILVVGTAQAVSEWLGGTIALSEGELVEEIVRMSAAAIREIRPDL